MLPLAGLRRHGAQALDGVFHRLAPVWRQAFELRVRGAELLLLLRRQVLPGFHAAQHLLLALGRHAVEALQALLEFLLPVRRKAAKIPVVLQRLALLLQRLAAVLVQPLAGMMAFGGRLVRRGRARCFVTRLRMRTAARCLARSAGGDCRSFDSERTK